MRNFFVVAMVLLLSSCSSWEQFKESTGITPKTSSVELVIDSSQALNTREGGQSSPVILRIHELSSPVLFRSLDFFALFENDKASLGDEYIKRYEFQLEPGEHLHQIIQLNSKTRALGFSAAFRHINGSSWRKVEMIKPKTRYYLHLKVQGSELVIDNTRGVEQTFF
ncbi:type VI secretion system lipoprotein TssJ [Vibrio profundum]|uniref:type VI secretion system lipoprotein TssJ n=1 Tax=Vibrio profundum TaxID=2910247 RepID=UPI003D0BF19C